MNRLLSTLLRRADGLRLRRGVGLRYRGTLDQFIAAGSPLAPEIAHWVDEYLCKPQPRLGRNGAVCPFMLRAVAGHRFHVAFHPELDGRRVSPLKDVLVSHSADFLQRFPLRTPEDELNSVLILFPSIPRERGGLMDDLHLEFKTHCMARGLMLAPMHPDSTRGGLRNATFEVFKAPYACMAVRYMSEHDLVWVSHNRVAFNAYRRRFGEAFAHGEATSALIPEYRAATDRFGNR